MGRPIYSSPPAPGVSPIRTGIAVRKMAKPGSMRMVTIEAGALAVQPLQTGFTLCERSVDRARGNAETLRDRRGTQLGPQLPDLCRIDADRAAFVFTGGLRLGDALVQPGADQQGQEGRPPASETERRSPVQTTRATPLRS
jgi:hypothetical protein